MALFGTAIIKYTVNAAAAARQQQQLDSNKNIERKKIVEQSATTKCIYKFSIFGDMCGDAKDIGKNFICQIGFVLWQCHRDHHHLC